MTCCLLVTIRFQPSRLLALRLGRHWRIWLVVIAAVELVAAALLVRALVALRGPQASVPTMPAMRSMPAMTAPGTVLIAAAALITLGAAGALLLRGEAPPRALMYFALGAYGVALIPAVRAAAAASHVVLMAQTMVLLVVAPAVLMSGLARSRASVPTRVRTAGWPLVAAGGYLAVLYLWHLPVTHAALMSDAGWDWVRIASCTAAGLVFWALARTDLAALLVAGFGSGLLGLALLVGSRPVFASTTDQRLAGLVMMALDLLILLPLIDRLLTATSDRPSLVNEYRR